MKLLKSASCVLFAAAISFTAHANEAAQANEVQTAGASVGHWTMDLEAAKQLAKEKGLPLMLNFTGSDWCGWCKLMDKNVFAQASWKEYAAENALLVTLDFPKNKSIVPENYVDRNKALKEQFGVRGYPTYVILDSDGATKIGQLGAGRDKTPQSFIAEFKGVVRLSQSNIEAFVKANPDKAETYMAAIQGVKDSKKSLADWIATRPPRNDENSKKFVELQDAIKTAEAKLAEF